MPELKTLLEPISNFVSELDSSDPTACEAALNERFPANSPGIESIREAAIAAAERGEICDRGTGGLRFSRIIKPQAAPSGCSVDAVRMENAKGPAHTHTRGEFCLCFKEQGEPTFEGRRDCWVVMPPGSRHVPTVKGGRMLILYWWPEGAVEW